MVARMLPSHDEVTYKTHNSYICAEVTLADLSRSKRSERTTETSQRWQSPTASFSRSVLLAPIGVLLEPALIK